MMQLTRRLGDGFALTQVDYRVWRAHVDDSPLRDRRSPRPTEPVALSAESEIIS
ncbi:hypothetical protein ACLMAJ_18715 [Nocardia sp. KC 131]|uniref:hypothetical protein n=1 Tax=Nocardia arseniciresistens TaxID=3392119 RepID=UPI00398EA221